MDSKPAKPDELTALRELAKRLVRDLDEVNDYATHDGTCEHWTSKRCTCGFDALDLRVMKTINEAYQLGIEP